MIFEALGSVHKFIWNHSIKLTQISCHSSVQQCYMHTSAYSYIPFKLLNSTSVGVFLTCAEICIACVDMHRFLMAFILLIEIDLHHSVPSRVIYPISHPCIQCYSSLGPLNLGQHYKHHESNRGHHPPLFQCSFSSIELASQPSDKTNNGTTRIPPSHLLRKIPTNGRIMIVIGVQYTKRTQRKHVEFDEVRKFPVLGDPTKCFHHNQRDYTLQTTTPQVIEKSQNIFPRSSLTIRTTRNTISTNRR